jgi:hypothetical protein
MWKGVSKRARHFEKYLTIFGEIPIMFLDGAHHYFNSGGNL